MDETTSQTPTPAPQRDRFGRFLPKAPFPSLGASVKTEDSKDPDDPLINIKINNPLHRIMHIVEEIRRHQATTFTLRFTIPLIALPIFLFAAFQLGRAQITCMPAFTTLSGTLVSVRLKESTISPSWWETALSVVPFIPQMSQWSSPTRLVDAYIVFIPGRVEGVRILPASGVQLGSLVGRDVVVSGNFSTCTHAMTLDAPENITLRR